MKTPIKPFFFYHVKGGTTDHVRTTSRLDGTFVNLTRLRWYDTPLGLIGARLSSVLFRDFDVLLSLSMASSEVDKVGMEGQGVGVCETENKVKVNGRPTLV